MPHRIIPAPIVSAATAVFVLSFFAHAELPVPGEVFDPKAERKLDVHAAIGGSHEFRRSLDDGGSVMVSRAGLDTTLKLELAEPLTLALSVGYRFDSYNFGGSPFPALGSSLDPWDDIHTLRFGGLLMYRINESWTVSGGGFGQFSAERDASWSDAFTGGGLASVTYRIGDRGVIGAGFGVTSTIEDSARFFPMLVVDYAFTDALRLSTLRVPSPIASSGLELVWEAAPRLEFAVGLEYNRRRFRLADRGPAPEGVGEERDLPVWLRGSWSPTDSIRLDLVGGVIAWREYRLDDTNGNRLAKDDGKATPFIGAALRVEF